MEKWNKVLLMAKYAKEQIPFYARLYKEVDLNKIQKEKELNQLPMITAEDIVNHFDELQSVNGGIYRITSSSGTLGKPKVIYRTQSDTEKSTEVLEELLRMAGVSEKDKVFIGQPFDMAHFGYLVLGGCERIGAMAIPAGIAMNNEQYLTLCKRYRPSVICTSFSRILSLIKMLKEEQVQELPFVKTIILAGEPVNVSGIEQIKKYFHTVPYNFYGSEETDGLAGDCEKHRGLHFFDDLFYLELLKLEGVQPEKEGNRIGEAVITSLYQRGVPLIRYRLGDIIEIEQQRCTCGDKRPLIHIYGRAKESFTLFDGITIMCYQIEAIVKKSFSDVLNYQIVLSTLVPGMEEMCIKVEKKDAPLDFDENKFVNDLWNCSEDLMGLRDNGALNIRVEINSSDIIVTQRGKTRRIIDLREGKTDERCSK